jgi:sulfite reductase (ferredoxin)
VLETEYLGARCPTVRRPAAALSLRDHVGVHPQKDGRVYVGFAPRAGRIAGHQLGSSPTSPRAAAIGRVAATAQQKLVILDVDAERADELIGRLEALDLRARPDPFRRA